MKFKKCGFLLSLIMIACFSLPSLASAKYGDLVSGMSGGYYDEQGFITDGDSKTFYELGDVQSILYKFSEPVDVDAFRLLAERNVVTVSFSDGQKTVYTSKNTETSAENLNLKNVKTIYLFYKGERFGKVKIYDFKVFGDDHQISIDEVGNLKSVPDVNNVSLTWDVPTEPKYIGSKIYKSNELIATVGKDKKQFLVGDLKASTNYEFKVVAQYEGGREAKGVVTKTKTLVDPKTLPPPNVTDLKAIDINEKSAVLQWVNPKHVNFDGVKIYADNRLLMNLGKDNNTFKLEGLKPEKNYKIKVTSINKLGGETEGSNLEINTTQPVLEPPEGINVTPQNGSLLINWDGVNSPYLKGYNVYVNGKKVNDKLLALNKLTVNGLKNEEAYEIQISSVNKSGVEGKKSKVVSGKPSGDAITVDYGFKMPFSPLDLLTSSVSLLAILGGFILLSIAIIWFRPLKELIVKAVRREKDKK